MKTYDRRLNVCPSCDSHKIEYEDDRPHIGLMHIRCTACGVQWLEPCERKVFTLEFEFDRDDETSFRETLKKSLETFDQLGLETMANLGWGDVPKINDHGKRVRGFWKLRDVEE